MVFHIAQELGTPVPEPKERKPDDGLPKLCSWHVNAQIHSPPGPIYFDPSVDDLAYFDVTCETVVIIPNKRRRHIESARNY